MQKSEYIARIAGPIMIVVGLGMLFNAVAFRGLADEFLRSPALIYLSGLLTLAAGLAIVIAHNLWSGGWRILVTILGWLMVIGGALRILLPRQVELIGGAMFAEPATLTICGIIVTVIGIILAWQGYGGDQYLAVAGTASRPRVRAAARSRGAARRKAEKRRKRK
ncbi:MAG: hypothetical protein KJZ73_15530 [Pseudorhodoplanes sp.]|nr:hypothetical protein [Pseudorhodoplanes sp.]